MKRKHIDDTLCSICGNKFKRVSGILRCVDCNVNKKYDIDDGRPRDYIVGRIKPIIGEE